MTAAWFVGLTGRKSFIRQIAELLLASEMVYAGSGYCVALGIIGGDECAGYLRSYLRKYLPLKARFYDQECAIGSLAHIENGAPQEFLDPALWTDDGHALDPGRGIQNFEQIYRHLREHRMIVPGLETPSG